MTKKTKANKKPDGVKQVLRDRFTKAGVVTPKQIDSIVAKLNVTRATVLTAISDLKNERYAGSLGVLAIEKNGDSYRLAK